MGKVNCFMPTSDCSLLEVFEGGEIYWCFVENEAKNSSCLTVTFIRNAANIKNARILEHMDGKGLIHLTSEKMGSASKKAGVFEELEFWNPHFEDIPILIKSSKEMFKLRLLKIDSQMLKTSTT